MAIKAGSDVPALAAIGLDIGKDVFHLVGLSVDGTIAFRRKIKRLALADTFKTLPPCIVGMEAFLSAHFVSRTLRALGTRHGPGQQAGADRLECAAQRTRLRHHRFRSRCRGMAGFDRVRD